MHKPDTPPATLTVAEIAHRWAASERTVLRAIERGDLVAIRVGPRVLRVRIEDLAAYEAASATRGVQG